MELKGKKIVFIGDSITEGVGASSKEKCFVTLVGERGEFREYKNYGIGGTRFAKQTKPSEKPRHDLDFCGRIDDLDEDADIVVMFGGTNDYGHGDAPLGTFEDRDLYTFYGACHFLMTRLHERFPGKPKLILTPLHRVEEERPKKGVVTPLRTYVNIIREMAEFYSLPVLDLYKESGLQPQVPLIRQMYFPDGLHPNDAGYEVIANLILTKLRSM